MADRTRAASSVTSSTSELRKPTVTHVRPHATSDVTASYLPCSFGGKPATSAARNAPGVSRRTGRLVTTTAVLLELARYNGAACAAVEYLKDNDGEALGRILAAGWRLRWSAMTVVASLAVAVSRGECGSILDENAEALAAMAP